MVDAKQLVRVGDAIAAAENPEGYIWYVNWRDTMHSVRFYNDSTDLSERFWIFGWEYGPEMLVHTYGDECSAHEIWIDELPVIPQDEVHEAYNAFDRLLEHMESKGHENTAQLRDFCTRWCKFYFEVDTKEDGAWDRWELDEAYQYQANATDSGIVYIGHHEWMEEIDPSDVFFCRKES